MKELDRQYGVKDRVVNQILEDVVKLVTPTSNDPVKCSEFHRAILSAVNDLADFESEDCLKNPAIIAQLVRKLPPQARDKWWEVLYSINGKVIPDKDEPDTFMAFVK